MRGSDSYLRKAVRVNHIFPIVIPNIFLVADDSYFCKAVNHISPFIRHTCLSDEGFSKNYYIQLAQWHWWWFWDHGRTEKNYADIVDFGLATSYENHYRHIIIVVMIVSMIGESPGQWPLWNLVLISSKVWWRGGGGWTTQVIRTPSLPLPLPVIDFCKLAAEYYLTAAHLWYEFGEVVKTLNLYLLRAQYRVRLYPWARGTFGGYIAVKVDASQNVSNFAFPETLWIDSGQRGCFIWAEWKWLGFIFHTFTNGRKGSAT